MRASLLLFLLLLLTFLPGCEEKVESEGPDCSLVCCAYNPISLIIRYIDKNTNKDLISDGNSLYFIRDLQIISNRHTTNRPIVKMDSTTNDLMVVQHVGSGDLLKLGNLPADVLKITTKVLSNACCSPYEITKLKINNKTICEPCKDLDERIITIKK